MPNDEVVMDTSYKPAIRTWDPDEAYQAFLENPIVNAVNDTLKSERAREIRKQTEQVVAKAAEAAPPLLKPDYWFRGQSNHDRLQSSLSRAAHGNKEDLQNKIFAEFASNGRMVTNRRAICQEFLDSVNWDTDLEKLVLLPHEEDQTAKAASRSLAWPWEIVGEKLTSSVMHPSPKVTAFQSTYYRKALDTIKRWVPEKSLVPVDMFKVLSKGSLTLEEQMQFYADNGFTPMDTTTSAGLPYVLPAWYPSEFLRQTDPALFNVVKRAFQDIIVHAKALRKEMGNNPSFIDQPHQILFQMNRRTNDPKGETDPDLKSTRLVMGVEKVEPLLAKTVTVPVTDMLKRLYWSEDGVKPFGAMMGSQYVDASVHSMLLGQQKRNDGVCSGDMSSYDGSINYESEMMIGEVVASWFRYETDRNFVKNLYMYAHSGVLLPTPDKLFVDSYCTRASGSGFTLLGNSLQLAAFLLYGHYAGAYRLRSFMVQGDDYLVSGDGVTLQVLSQVAEELGFTSHPDKGKEMTGYAEFLQNDHTVQFPGGIASAARTLCHMAAPERRVAGIKESQLPYFDVVRALGQLHNCEFHPKFEYLVEFVKAYDRNRLFEKLSFAEVIRLSGNAGEDLLREYFVEGRKAVGRITGEMQLSNRARQGERVPAPEDRYPLVYGKDWETVLWDKEASSIPINIAEHTA